MANLMDSCCKRNSSKFVRFVWIFCY